MRIAPAITLSPEQRTVLESQARSRSLPVRVAERARIVLFAASGQQAPRSKPTSRSASRQISTFPHQLVRIGVNIPCNCQIANSL